MASKHLAHHQSSWRANQVIAVVSFAIAFAAITAALAVRVVDGRATPAQTLSGSVPAVPQSLSQEGRLIAVTPSSVTAESADGFARTYTITAETNAVTEHGSVIGGAGTAFAVNDEVAIVGIVRDGTAIATAVVDRHIANLNGPPMDTV